MFSNTKNILRRVINIANYFHEIFRIVELESGGQHFPFLKI